MSPWKNVEIFGMLKNMLIYLTPERTKRSRIACKDPWSKFTFLSTPHPPALALLTFVTINKLNNTNSSLYIKLF